MKQFAKMSFACAALCAVLAGTQSANGQISVLAGLAFNTGDAVDLGLTAGAHVGFEAGGYSLIAAPSLDIYPFDDFFSITRLNLDVLYPFGNGTGSIAPHAGVGVLVQFLNFDSPLVDTPFGGFGVLDGSSTDLGLNLRVGAQFMDSESALRPFVDAVLALNDFDTDLSLRGGITYRVSQ